MSKSAMKYSNEMRSEKNSKKKKYHVYFTIRLHIEINKNMIYAYVSTSKNNEKKL